MKAIFKKEVKSYLYSPIGYVFIAVFIAISGYFFAATNLFSGRANLAAVFSNISFVFIFLIPILTMRLLAEEKHTKTDQLLLTSRLKTSDIVLGKLFAATFMLALALAVTLVYPLILWGYTTLSWGVIASNYLGFLLMGIVYCAVGLFISSLTENQIISAAATFAILLMLYVADWISPALNNAAASAVIDWISVAKRFSDFGVGLINVEYVIYYISAAGLFVFFTVRHIEKRRLEK